MAPLVLQGLDFRPKTLTCVHCVKSLLWICKRMAVWRHPSIKAGSNGSLCHANRMKVHNRL